MRPMQFGPVEARAFGPERGEDEILDNLLDLHGRKRARAGFRIVPRTDNGRLDQFLDRPPARVLQLHC